MITSNSGNTHSDLVGAYLNGIKRNFLVDTGAAASMIHNVGSPERSRIFKILSVQEYYLPQRRDEDWRRNITTTSTLQREDKNVDIYLSSEDEDESGHADYATPMTANKKDMEEEHLTPIGENGTEDPNKEDAALIILDEAQSEGYHLSTMSKDNIEGPVMSYEALIAVSNPQDDELTYHAKELMTKRILI